MVSITASAGTVTLLRDTFDRQNNSLVGSGWIEVAPAEATVSIANNQLFFDDTSDVALRPLVKKGFSLVSAGTLQWDFDFYWVRSGNEGTYRLLMQLGDSSMMSDASQNGGAGVNLIWTSINGAHQSLGYRKAGVNTALAVVSGPAHISVVADLGTKSYSVAVNGAEIGTGIPFDADVPLDTVRLFTDNLNDKNFSGRTIDNLSVFTGSAGNTPPVAAAGSDQGVQAGATVNLDGGGSTDAKGEPMTYGWTLTTVPTGSSASLSREETVSPSFVADLAGTYFVQLVVNDGLSDSAPDTVSITAALAGNTAPVAADDSASTSEDAAVSITVLGNDTDANGDTLGVTNLTQPSNGVVTPGSNNTVTYTPVGGFTGTDSFTYTANDGLLDSDVATVVVSVGGPLVISDMTDASGKTYQVVDSLVVGDLVYADRTYTFTTLPPSILDATLVRTFNSDKNRTESTFLSFKVNRGVEVYVAYDSRATSPPTWLRDWVDTGLILQTTDTPRQLYSKMFTPGIITVGGNLATGAAGAGSNYSLAILSQGN